MLGYMGSRSLNKLRASTPTNCAGITGGSLQMSSDTLSNEAASRNLVRSLMQAGKLDKVKELAQRGNPFATAALEHHKKNEEKAKTPHVKQTSRYAAKQAKGTVDFSQLEGPAAAGKNGGGGQSHVTPPKPKGHGVKTNVGGGNGPKKTATTIVKDAGGGKKGKGKKDKK